MFSSLFSAKGRIGRGGYWLIAILQAIPTYVLIYLIEDAKNDQSVGLLLIYTVLLLTLAWIGICNVVKRFHDRGKSGWWCLISLVPFIGSVWIFVECGLLTGEDCVNEYGAPPGSIFGDGDPMQEPSSGLAKVDDEYLRRTARALDVTPAPSMSHASPAGGGGSARPVFGRRA
jgi:uncharacterized membrane protein YhaH (DUF805 family)